MKNTAKKVGSLNVRTLKESELRYRRLFEAAQDGILILDARTGMIEEVNPYLIKMLGYSRKEFLKKKLWEVGAFRDIEASQDAFEALQEKESIRYEDLLLKTKDGRLVQVEFVCNVYLVGDEKVIQCNIRDITQRKLVEGVLQDTNEYAENLIGTAKTNKEKGAAELAIANKELVFKINERKRAEEAIRSLARFPSENPNPILRIAWDGNLLYGNPASFTLLKKWKLRVGKPAPEVLKNLTREALRTETMKTVDVLCGDRIFEITIAPAPKDKDVNLYARDITKNKQAEEALRQSENTVLAWLNSIQESAFLMDREGIILAVNATTAQRLRHSVEELVGACIYDFIPPQTAHARRLHIAQVIESGQPVRFEDERSGRVIDNIIYPVFDLSGQVKHMAVLGTDITERKQAESAMMKMRTLLNETQEISAIGGWEYDIAAGRVFWTDEVYRLHGVSKEYDPGNPAEDMQFYAPEDQKTIDEAFQLAVKAGTPYDLELQLITAAGERLWVRTMGRAEIKDGKVIRVLGNIMDISERKQREEQIRWLNIELEATVEKRTAQLQETLELNQKMIEASSLGIFACRAEGPCIIANPAIARISGTTVEKMLQLNFRELENWRKNGLFDMAEAALATGEERHAESHLTTAFGKDVWLNYYFTTFISNGRLHFLMLVDDVTERKRTEVALQQRTVQLEAANKELEAFSYSISHDLRSPLRAMDGFSRILLEEYTAQLPAEAQRYLGLVRSNTQQMGHLIEDLLAFSRLSRLPLNKQTVAMAEVVRKALAELRAEQEGRNVEVTIGSLPACEADPALLKQVWVNLLSNALKFTQKREAARIEVGWTHPLPGEKPVEGCYFIKDNGVGFDMQYVNKLFGVFQRLHRSEEYEGTGVGLAIVQRIVHRHGGRIWTEAEVDKGAAFYFTLEGGT